MDWTWAPVFMAGLYVGTFFVGQERHSMSAIEGFALAVLMSIVAGLLLREIFERIDRHL